MVREHRKYNSTCFENTESTSVHVTRIPKAHQHILREYRKYTNTEVPNYKVTLNHYLWINKHRDNIILVLMTNLSYYIKFDNLINYIIVYEYVCINMCFMHNESCSLTSMRENKTTITHKTAQIINSKQF